MTLSLFNRPHQRIPQLSGTDALQGEFRCHECGAFLRDIGTGRVMWRCVNAGCAQRAIDTKEAAMPSNLSLAIFCAVASIVAILLDAPDLVTGACGGAFLLAGFLALGDVTDEPFDVGEPE